MLRVQYGCVEKSQIRLKSKRIKRKKGVNVTSVYGCVEIKFKTHPWVVFHQQTTPPVQWVSHLQMVWPLQMNCGIEDGRLHLWDATKEVERVEEVCGG